MRFQKYLPLLSDTSTFLKWNSWTKVHYCGINWIWIFLPTIFLVKPITLKITINLIFLALVLWVREIYAKRFEKSIFHFSNQIVASYTYKFKILSHIWVIMSENIKECQVSSLSQVINLIIIAWFFFMI